MEEVIKKKEKVILEVNIYETPSILYQTFQVGILKD